MKVCIAEGRPININLEPIGGILEFLAKYVEQFHLG
jgi:hypothetical protein